MQAQAVQTGNRLLTPLIPPLASSSLDASGLADCVLGMVYGAVLGDTLGQLTVGMTDTEAQFHYSRDTLHLTRGAPDLHRSRLMLFLALILPLLLLFLLLLIMLLMLIFMLLLLLLLLLKLLLLRLADC